jgi:type VI secretion system secreted protein VgrG
MGSYVQQNRKVRVTTPLGKDLLLLKAFSGTEEISRPFRFQVEMIAENKAKVPFDGVLGEKVTVHLVLPDESTEQHFNGVCVRFVQAGRDEEFTAYRAELVPEFQLLARKAQSRIFQRMNVPDILKEVMKGVTVEWKIQGTFEKRDFCVQYRESDFNFASRLMEEEGIFYFFRHEDGTHTMVVANDASAFPELPGENEILYEELAGGTRDENRIWAWERAQEARSTKVVLWDHSFELPHKHLEAEEPILDSVNAGRETHKLKVKGSDKWELYDWPGEYAQRFDGVNRSGGEQEDELQKIFQDNARTVGLRMDEEATLAVSARGASNVKHLVAGHKLKLKRHFSSDGEYVLSSVTHRASFGADYRSGKALLAYQNSFVCFPAALPYCPKRLTAKPVVQGSQTAVVVGPKGEEIFTDKYGRVKVQFHWDRKGKSDEDSSCWVRVGQTAAGRRWGSSYWPRIGQEVIVDFLEGDPDQPIVVGTVYNPDQMPPYLGDGPDGKHKNDNKVSGFKSNTTKGGSGFNELRFDDAKDKQQVFLHAERNMDVRVKKDAMESVLNDKHLTVGQEKDGEKKGSYFEKVFKDKHVAVLGTLQEKVGDAKLTVGGDEGNGNLDVNVSGAMYLTVGGAYFVRCLDKHWELVDESFGVKAEEDLFLRAGANGCLMGTETLHLFGGERVLLGTSSGELCIRAGGSFIKLTPSEVTIVGDVVKINSGGSPVSLDTVAVRDVPEAATAAPTAPTAADDAKSGQKSS